MRPTYRSPDARVLTFRGQVPEMAPGVFLAPGTTVIGAVTIGEDSSIWYHAVLRGDVHSIRVGKRSNIQDGTVVHVTADAFPVAVGDDVTIGHAAIIHGCTLEDGCLVGMGAKILDGAVVGKGTLVAAGSVVAPGTVLPPGVLAMGAPARVKREVSDSERGYLVEAPKLYVGYARAHAAELGLDSP